MRERSFFTRSSESSIDCRMMSFSSTIARSRMTSSVFTVVRSFCSSGRLIIGISSTPGIPEVDPRERVYIRPEITMTSPFLTRAMVSDSLVALDASGKSLSKMRFTSSLTSLRIGWMCKMMSPASLICGVTSKAMPEKNGSKLLFELTTLPPVP